MRIGKVEIERYKKSGYNNPKTNERTVELPLGFYFLKKFSDTVELGAVTPYYKKANHDVWDLHDPHQRCIPIDFSSLDFSVKGKNVLSISTVEHIGFNDYSKTHGRFPEDIWHKGFDVLRKVTLEAQQYLITFAIGYNPTLDILIEESSIPRVVLRRIDADNNWEIDLSGSMKYLFGPPQGDFLLSKFNGSIKIGQIPAKFPRTNALCIVTNVKELLKK